MPQLTIVDLNTNLAPEIIHILQRAATVAPRAVNHDWRDVAARFLYRKFRDREFWIYCGGSHIAIHASPPEGNRHQIVGEAGNCLCRIVETKQ